MADDSKNLAVQVSRVVGGHNNTLRAILKLFGITNADTLKADDMSATVGNVKVPIKNGGTGKASMTDYLIHYGQFSQLSRPATAGSVLRQGTSGAPYWTPTNELGLASVEDMVKVLPEVTYDVPYTLTTNITASSGYYCLKSVGQYLEATFDLSEIPDNAVIKTIPGVKITGYNTKPTVTPTYTINGVTYTGANYECTNNAGVPFEVYKILGYKTKVDLGIVKARVTVVTAPSSGDGVSVSALSGTNTLKGVPMTNYKL